MEVRGTVTTLLHLGASCGSTMKMEHLDPLTAESGVVLYSRVAGVRDAVSTVVLYFRGIGVCLELSFVAVAFVKGSRSCSACLPAGVRLAGCIFPLVFCVGVQSAYNVCCCAGALSVFIWLKVEVKEGGSVRSGHGMRLCRESNNTV